MSHNYLSAPHFLKMRHFGASFLCSDGVGLVYRDVRYNYPKEPGSSVNCQKTGRHPMQKTLSGNERSTTAFTDGRTGSRIRAVSSSGEGRCAAAPGAGITRSYSAASSAGPSLWDSIYSRHPTSAAIRSAVFRISSE